MRSQRSFLGIAKAQICMFITAESKRLLVLMAGPMSYGEFVEKLICREYERRLKKSLVVTTNR